MEGSKLKILLFLGLILVFGMQYACAMDQPRVAVHENGVLRKLIEICSSFTALTGLSYLFMLLTASYAFSNNVVSNSTKDLFPLALEFKLGFFPVPILKGPLLSILVASMFTGLYYLIVTVTNGFLKIDRRTFKLSIKHITTHIVYAIIWFFACTMSFYGVFNLIFPGKTIDTKARSDVSGASLLKNWVIFFIVSFVYSLLTSIGGIDLDSTFKKYAMIIPTYLFQCTVMILACRNMVTYDGVSDSTEVHQSLIAKYSMFYATCLPIVSMVVFEVLWKIFEKILPTVFKKGATGIKQFWIITRDALTLLLIYYSGSEVEDKEEL
jgi:hypothetical protein